MVVSLYANLMLRVHTCAASIGNVVSLVFNMLCRTENFHWCIIIMRTVFFDPPQRGLFSCMAIYEDYFLHVLESLQQIYKKIIGC